MLYVRPHRPGSSSSPASVKRQKRARRRPAFESLEERTLLASVVLGGLEFQSDSFTQQGTVYKVGPGSSAFVGLVPAVGKPFTSLAQISLSTQGAPGGLTFDTSAAVPSFSIANGAIDAVVQGGPPLPVFQTPNAVIAQSFDVASLLSANGVGFGQNTLSQPIQVAKLSFAPAALVFANGTGGDTTQSEIQLQGTLTPPTFTNFNWAGLTLNVTGGNYVHIASAGVSLDGASLATQAYSWTAFGMTIAVTPTVAYSSVGGDTFTFGGSATLSTPAQGFNQVKALDQVGAGLSLVVKDGAIAGLSFNITGTVKFLDLQFATDSGNPLGFSYDLVDDRYEIKGGLTTTFGDDGESSVDLNLGYADNPSDPGIIIQNGTLSQFNATINTALALAGANLTTNGNGLTFSYDAAEDQFEMYGGSANAALSLNLANSRSISVFLGDSASPGLVVKGGTLQAINMGVSGQFDLAGMAVRAQQATIDYVKAEDQYMLSGTLSVTGIFNASLSLGTQAQPGIVIKDDDFQLEAISFTLGQANLGAFSIKDLSVAYARSGGDYTISGGATLVFPAGWAVGGSFSVLDGKIDSLGLSYTAAGIGGGIAIGPTGLFLVSLSGSVANLDNPANIVVTASAGVVYGEEITILGRSVAIFAATGTVTVDKDEFKLVADAYFGAYGTATSFQGILGTGSATVDLDWGDQDYSASLDVVMFDGAFEFEAAFQMDTTSNIMISAKAIVAMPRDVPFIGGKKLASLDFLLEYHAHGGPNGEPVGFAAGWAEVDVFGTHDVGVKYDMITKDFSIIGTSGVKNLTSDPTPAPGIYYYYYTVTVPTGATNQIDATTATLGVQFTLDGGNQTVAISTDGANYIDQSQFSTANGLTLVPTLNTIGQITVDAVGSSADPTVALPSSTYYLRLASTVLFSTTAAPAFTASFSYPKPTVAVSLPVNGPLGGTEVVTVTFATTVAQAFRPNTLVSLYYDGDASGYDGALVQGGLSLASLANGIPFDLSGLLPGTYYLYASINDGTNAPVLSAYTVGVVPPPPPISGTVADKAHGNVSLSGFTVYVDLNGNGQFDPGSDPGTTSQGSGYYQFDAASLTPLTSGSTYNVTVVVPQGYLVASSSQGSYSYTYNPTSGDNYNFPFALDELDSISGTVFDDLSQDGTFDPADTAWSGVTVYVDANNNGQFDQGEPTATSNNAGLYKFYDVTAGTPYTIRPIVPAGSFLTAPASQSYTVTVSDQANNGQATGNDFGLLRYVTISGTLSGYSIDSGRLASGTNPLAGWTVNLLSGSTVVKTTTSDGSGVYSFTVAPGSWTVSQVVPSGWIQLAPATTQVQYNPVFYPLGTAPNSSALADFDGDGKLDFVVTNPNDPGADLSVFFGNGDGTFAGPVDTSLPTHGALFVVAIDSDYGGKLLPDLAVLTASGTVYILTNTDARSTNGFVPRDGLTFSIPQGTTPLGMISGNFSSIVQGPGGEDLAIMYKNQGSNAGGFEIWVAATAGLYAQSLADVTAIMAFNTDTNAPGAMATGDINGDGFMDLVLIGGTSQNNLSVVFGDGTGGANGLLNVQSLTLANIAPTSLAVADINGDGSPDVLLAGASLRPFTVVAIEYLLNSGARFSEAPGSSAPLILPTIDSLAYSAIASLADINADGLPDAVILLNNSLVGPPTSFGPVLYTFTNTGRNSIGSQFNPFVRTLVKGSDSLLTSLNFGDFNGDGLLSAILTDRRSNGVFVAQNQSILTPLQIAVQLAPDQNSTGNNYLNARTGQVSGTIYLDSNRTGTRQAGEAGVAGATIYLDLNGNGVLDPAEPSTMTNIHGAYAFDGLAPGQYQLRLLDDRYGILTTPGLGYHVVTVADGVTNPSRNFGADVSLLAPLGDQAPSVLVGTSVQFPVTPSATATGQTLRFTLEPGAPTGATIDPRTGVFSWTPTMPGTYLFTVRARDVNRPTISENLTFTVTVLPSYTAPMVAPIANLTLVEGGSTSLAVAATDPSLPAGALIYSLDPSSPPGATIDPVTGVFSWTADVAPGVYSVTVRVTNATMPALTTTTSFQIGVRNVPPLIAPIKSVTLPEGGFFVASGFFADPGRGGWVAAVDYGDGSAPTLLALGADKTFQLSHRYARPGNYVATVAIRDGFGGLTLQTMAVNVTGPPTVSQVVVGDGTPQRSQISQLALVFTGPVSIAAGAFVLRGPGNRSIKLSISFTTSSEGNTIATLGFSGPGTLAGLLKTGKYRLLIRSGRIVDGFDRQLDGDGDGKAGGNKVVRFHRLRGDLNGDGRIDRPERQRLQAARVTVVHRRAVPQGPRTAHTKGRS